MDFGERFPQGLSYSDFLDQHGTPEHRRRWNELYDRVRLTPAQIELLAGFRRQMKVLVLAGAWCGDCVHQCPILERFSQNSSVLEIRYFDRDAHGDLAAALRMCGGSRVPIAVFLSEDGQEVSRFGDRTLAQYRQLYAQLTGAYCPTGIVGPEQSDIDQWTAEWLDQFERAQLVLRLSPRLRQKHGD